MGKTKKMDNRTKARRHLLAHGGNSLGYWKNMSPSALSWRLRETAIIFSDRNGIPLHEAEALLGDIIKKGK